MQAFIDQLIKDGAFAGVPKEVVYAIAMVVVALVVLSAFVAPLAGVTSWLERRVWARMQSRVGPNRVGPQGILQWLADGIKNLLKEDLIPSASDAKLFSLAPYIVFMGFLCTFVVIPFGANLIVADLNIGILYILAVTSLVVVGILMAGWASNNKWSLLGGMRSAAQIVSYEIPAGLSILTIIFLAGTMSMQGIIKAQGWAPWDWFLFDNPFTFAAFFLYFTAALAEGNRTPFDIPEAESELVAGYVTEYSGMRFLFFFFAEWGNLYVIGAVATTLFLGGWQVPPLPIFDNSPVLLGIAQFVTFFLKAYAWVFIAMWVRATLPRVRVDQLMGLCWKYMVPLSFVCLLGTIGFMFMPADGRRIFGIITFGFALATMINFFRRVVFQIRAAKPELYFKPQI
ncbi:MAG TPA: NADH-quinone oxidoreductase subunit NuoH [Candidatus Saccharimonadales bacterium]|jgi:NADH-quinone oxidoreductase subunit H|nr:NADH-quinone oxidoreductase subunit NuoH [Candidatus Saccharimonadales bacterium]